MVRASGINAMLVADYLPELGANLVAALPSLQELLAGLGGVHIGLNNEYCFGDSDMVRLGIPVPLGTDNAS